MSPPRPIHILHAAKIYPPPFGGIETVLEKLTQGISDYDPTAQLDVLATHPAPPSHQDFRNGRIKIDRIRSIAQIARTPIALGYTKALRKSQADLFHFHFPYPWAELSYLISGVKRPYVVSYHSDVVRQKNLLKLWEPFMQRFLDGAARVVVASPHIIKDSLVLQKLAPNKISIIPYGIETDTFIPTNESIKASEELRIRLAGNGPLIFFLGRLVYYKGVEVLIEAMQTLDAHLVIGGEGPLRNDLQSAVHAAGLEAKITFAGSIPSEALPLYYQASDLFVLPSTDTSEAFGMVMLEAHASGIPVICTNLPTGMVFVNQHEKTGLCVPPRDPRALSEAIQVLISNPDLRKSMGAFAQTRAIHDFDTRIMSQRYHQLYRDILSTSQNGSGACA